MSQAFNIIHIFVVIESGSINPKTIGGVLAINVGQELAPPPVGTNKGASSLECHGKEEKPFQNLSLAKFLSLVPLSLTFLWRKNFLRNF